MAEDSNNLVAVKSAIDSYLSSSSSLVPGIEVLILIYVDEVMGFKETAENIEKIVEESEGAVTKEELDQILEEQKKAAIEKLKDPTSGIRKEFEAKVNELKALIAELSKLVKEIAKQLAQSITSAIMPTMLSVGVPNPAYTALRIVLFILEIKRSVDAILTITSKVLGMILGLGLDKIDIVDKITNLVQPILSLKSQLESRQREAESELALASDGAKERYEVVNPLTGQTINYSVIEGKAKEWEINEWPLTKKAAKKVKRKIRKSEDEDDNDDDIWGKIIIDYNDFLYHIRAVSLGLGTANVGGGDNPGGDRPGQL